MKKKISVCMATYNGEQYIKEQLESILSQLGNQDEVIISDDHSTDNTLDIVNRLSDNRIRVFLNDNKNGLTYNFENAIKKATGDYIFLSDQDDVWLPNKVQLAVEAFQKNDVVVSNCKITDGELFVINESYFKLNNSQKGFFKNFYRSSYLGCCTAFKKEILVDILPFPRNLYLYHDWWIGYLSDMKYKVKFIETPCLLYRRHDNNMSSTGGTSKQSLFKRIRDRFQLLYLGNLRLLKLK
ncbi:glycosyltransferase family 2 protein [Epilithonimonas sp.]|uniref:glycosyltransferase family 2 protein n=1 Tax=Epilithonimonas sp. TaxID=2894511 RepID=UPI0028A12240|nr:glycosyltransferase family 2 protein [Epilithonimonas sp.]